MVSFPDEDFFQLNTYLDELKPSKLFILVDENTHGHCLPTLLGNLETSLPFEILEIESGEEMKTLTTAAHLWEILAEFEADRKALLINLGGGVITDLGGFVASTYKRGIKFINIPTTLLAMCDASIGGKTGIDHQFIKNIIGTFAAADHVFVYPDFLKSLPFAELRSGFAEMLKHGLIADEKHWEDLIALPDLEAEQVFPHIKRSMDIKLEIVEQDFREQNIRKTLNFGHTVGHAIESIHLESGKPILHGEAVAAGMICEAWLSANEKIIAPEEANRIIENIRRFFPPIDLSAFPGEDLVDLMRKDKKNSRNRINFSLPEKIGRARYDVHIPEENIYHALHYYQNLT
ncbi:MAG: 3-dehydroquinate synthase [Weeksellaceae bacterium]|nr:3-dehydroquinate synthase [Weeksellaceae bacterium]